MDRKDHALGLWTSKGIEALSYLTMIAPDRHDLRLADRPDTTLWGGRAAVSREPISAVRPGASVNGCMDRAGKRQSNALDGATIV